MRSKLTLFIAGLAAFLLGMPLAEKATASDATGDIAGSAFDLANAIAWAVTEAS